MANKKSAIKKARHDAKLSAENKRIKKNLKKLLKKASREDLPQVYKKLDKAAKRRIIHPNKSSRLKSRFAKNARKKIN